MKLDAEAAEERLQQEERERRDFIAYHFHVDPDDPTLYDLVVNTETLGLDRAARLVADAFRDRFPSAVRGATPRRAPAPIRTPLEASPTAG